jgi:hypothetical protein
MLNVIWEINGLHVVNLMTEQHSHSAYYLLSKIMERPRRAIFPDGWKVHSRQPRLHLDRGRIHSSKPLKLFSPKITMFGPPSSL